VTLTDNSDSSDVDNSCGLGILHFTLSYDFPKRSLVVQIHEAKELLAKDANGTSDPYVKVMQSLYRAAPKNETILLQTSLKCLHCFA